MTFSQGPYQDAIEKLDFNTILTHISSFATSVTGKERIHLLTPSSTFGEVRDELERVGEMMALIEKDDEPPLGFLADIRAVMFQARIEGSILDAESLLNVLRTLRVSKSLSSFFSKRQDTAMLLGALAEQLFYDKSLEYHIDRVVDEEGHVRDSASKELREIRRALIEKSSGLRRRLETILKKVSKDAVLQEEIITMRDGRMVLPVKVEYKNTVAGFIHSASSSGQTVYIEPTETLELNNEIRELEFEEIREVQKLLSELTTRVRQFSEPLAQSISILAEIDSIYARAKYADNMDARCPRLTKQALIEINFGKHPILLLHKKSSDVVPISVTIGGQCNTIVITGPNAGGKSVAMKTVGLLCLMLQSGIPIPADSTSQFPLYHRIAVDIGDEQSIENDLSTFSSHVRRLTEIVEHVNDKTLVLIDEIGTGTDPAEGSALGAAILDYVAETGAHTIATTHHGMLKAFADQHPHMQNAAMEFNLSTLEPTYRFRAGLPGSSYAFEITRRHGMKPVILDRAKDLLGNQSGHLEDLLMDVERRAQLLAQQTKRLEQDQDRLDTLLQEYTQKNADLKREVKVVKRKALEDANEIIASANAAIEEAVRAIREEHAEKAVVKKARDQISALKQGFARELDAEQKTDRASAGNRFVKDDLVTLKENRTMQGIVLDVFANGDVSVSFGSVKLIVEGERLEKINAQAATPKKSFTPVLEPSIESNEIDVRGLYGDEAIRQIDIFLYEAYAAGLKRVDIIHGKGTGALRTKVHEYLKGISFVESFQLANWNEGGAGNTVVLFK